MEEEKRTQFAMAAVDFAGLFNQTFAESVAPGVQIQLTSPEGQSTGGGVQALQHVTLIQQSEGISQVVGSANNFERSAEVRSYGRVTQQFKERYPGKAFPVGQQVYNQLIEKLSNFFKSQSLAVSVSETVAIPAAGAVAQAPAQKKSSALIIYICLLVLALAAGAAYFLFFYKQ
jgi:hypothetical protein